MESYVTQSPHDPLPRLPCSNGDALRGWLHHPGTVWQRHKSPGSLPCTDDEQHDPEDQQQPGTEPEHQRHDGGNHRYGTAGCCERHDPGQQLVRSRRSGNQRDRSGDQHDRSGNQRDRSGGKRHGHEVRSRNADGGGPMPATSNTCFSFRSIPRPSPDRHVWGFVSAAPNAPCRWSATPISRRTGRGEIALLSCPASGIRPRRRGWKVR